MKIKIEGKLDPLVFLGKKTNKRAGFSNIMTFINIQSSASKETLEEWAKKIKERCPVSDNLQNLTPIQVTLNGIY